MSRAILAVLGMSLSALTAWGSTPPPPEPTPASGSPGAKASIDTSSAMLQVDNRAFQDMTVYLIYNSQRVRLGVAPGNAVTALRIAPHFVATGPTSLRFIADPIGGRHVIESDPIAVAAGIL